MPFLTDGQTPDGWRGATLSESIGETNVSDPDYLPYIPPPFSALRSERWLYVEYDDGSTALYDQSTDPYELRNIVDRRRSGVSLPPLSAQLSQLDACLGFVLSRSGRSHHHRPATASSGLTR